MKRILDWLRAPIHDKQIAYFNRGNYDYTVQGFNDWYYPPDYADTLVEFLPMQPMVNNNVTVDDLKKFINTKEDYQI